MDDPFHFLQVSTVEVIDERFTVEEVFLEESRLCALCDRYI